MSGTDKAFNLTDYKHGRRDGMLEAAAWLEDAAGRHLQSSAEWSCFTGAAKFMRQRSEEIRDAV